MLGVFNTRAKNGIEFADPDLLHGNKGGLRPLFPGKLLHFFPGGLSFPEVFTSRRIDLKKRASPNSCYGQLCSAHPP